MPPIPGRPPSLRRLMSDWDTAAHGNGGWLQFLTSIKVSGLRGWTGELVEFRFPVVAIAGENGSGKSTILKAAAAAYINSAVAQKTLNPDDFFPKTQWEAVEGVRLEYTYREGDRSPSHAVRKPTKRWIGLPERPSRRLYFLDITRTQPIDSLVDTERSPRNSRSVTPRSSSMTRTGHASREYFGASIPKVSSSCRRPARESR
jgi:predicted ATP-dependent endonuclease of OLD family